MGILIEAFFGSLITLILFVILLACWCIIFAIPGLFGMLLFRIRKIRVALLVAVILVTMVYYAYFPWHVFENIGNNYETSKMAATGWVKSEDFDKNGISFLFYQAKIIIYTDHLFASYRYVKALAPYEGDIIAKMVQAIGLVMDFPFFVILFLVYNILGLIIAALFMIWPPTLTMLIGFIITLRRSRPV